MMLRHHDNVDVALALTAGSVPAAISDILRLRSQKLAAMVKLRSSGTVWTVVYVFRSLFRSIADIASRKRSPLSELQVELRL
jgi:hypothetical protein